MKISIHWLVLLRVSQKVAQGRLRACSQRISYKMILSKNQQEPLRAMADSDKKLENQLITLWQKVKKVERSSKFQRFICECLDINYMSNLVEVESSRHGHHWVILF